MRIKNLLITGFTALALAACSGEETLNKIDNESYYQGEGRVNISLRFIGAEGGSRAVNEFAFGTGEESQIKDVTVYYFDTDSKYLGSSGTITEFTTTDGNADVNANIEKTISAKVPATVISGLGTEDKANIIVIVNQPADFPTGFNDYAAFNKAITTTDNAGFMMSNSTYYAGRSLPAETGTNTYFTPITGANIITDNANASETQKVTVYVERVCGKVTLSAKDRYTSPNNARVDILKWGLNVRNTVVYPVKVLTDAFSQITEDEWPGADDWNAADKYRSHWAIDPNYDGVGYSVKPNAADNPFKIIQFSDLKAGLNSPQYCLENTFNYPQQDKDETTTAVFYAQYIPFGISNLSSKTWVVKDGSEEYLSLKTFIENFLITQDIRVSTGSGYRSATLDDIRFSYNEVEDANGNVIGGKAYTIDSKNGVQLYKNTTPLDNEGIAELQKAFEEECKQASIYVNGYCYYEIPIKHFAETEVGLHPSWKTDESAPYKQEHLGRYGIVRNHWYKLTINAIRKPGKPIEGDTIIPEDGTDDDKEKKDDPDPDPDPDPEYGIDVTIQVLSWAVRSQSVEL